MFHLSIVTPEKIFCECEISSLTVPGSDGYLGILTGHAPLITALIPGKIEYLDNEGNEHIVAVAAGFLEVSGNKVTLLADAAEDFSELNIDRAKEAYNKAWNQIKAAAEGDPSINLKVTRDALERSRNRIRIYEDTH